MDDVLEGAVCGIDGCTPAAFDQVGPASGAKATLAIEVISDAICPWCWVAKRRLNRALAALGARGGDALTLEPFRAEAFPVTRDLMVDRSAFDRIIAAGGFISVPIGAAPDANAMPVRKENADLAMDAAACIGCGACVAACPNASAMLFTSAKISQLALLPQGQPERYERVLNMVAQMDAEQFGSCTNHGECEATCPKGINLNMIARMNRDYIKATLLRGRRDPGTGGEGVG